MRPTVLEHLRGLFAAHRDLAESLPPEALTGNLPAPSNTIGEQFWCIVGARESYAAAIESGEWQGFSCSLTEPGDPEAVIAALDRSAAGFERVITDLTWDDVRDDLLVDLLEHEAQHQGQLIRYVYAGGYRFPDSWAGRWSLAQPD